MGQLKAHLAEKFADKVEISNDPVEVPQGQDKPFEVKVDGAVIYSHLAPLNGEKGPILLESNKWWGEPDPAKIKLVEDKIAANL